jgi:predicted DNA-binding transcriptional regulator AlpA
MKLQIAPTPAAHLAASKPTDPQPERLFTLAQIQAAGGFSRSTLYRLRHGGGLRVVSVGGVTRVRESDWLRFLDRHATATLEGGASE